MKKAVFEFNFNSIKEAEIISESMKPEIEHNIPKTDVSIKIEKKKIILEIKAKDISSLRAACNSYLRWMKIAFDVENKI